MYKTRYHTYLQILGLEQWLFKIAKIERYTSYIYIYTHVYFDLNLIYTFLVKTEPYS